MSFYETASQGRSSSMSYDTATLQPESPPNLNALEEDLAGEEGEIFFYNSCLSSDRNLKNEVYYIYFVLSTLRDNKQSECFECDLSSTWKNC